MHSEVSQQEYADRRKQLCAGLKPGSVVLVHAPNEIPRANDMHYPYYQYGDFYYLTGFHEPEAVMVLLPDGDNYEYILFNRPKDPYMEVWHGYRVGQEGAVQQYGANQAYPIAEFETRLIDLLQGKSYVYYPVGFDNNFDQQVLHTVNKLRQKVRSGTNTPVEFINVSYLLHEMRLFKSPAELDIMRQAGKVSAAAHVRAMQYCKPGMFEYELEAEIIHEFMRHGSRRVAYDSIIGAGSNSCVLHYNTNDMPIKDGDLVLIDAGCELQNYTSDITRTFPANGKFTKEQQAIYEVVLATQEAAIAATKPGVRLDELDLLAERCITQGLLDLGLLTGDLDGLLEQRAFQQFYMHRLGHWLGIDAHDVGRYKIDGEWRCLESNMVRTIEPGIYIAPNSPVDEKWWGIGVRIEDDVILTDSGCEVYTNDVPKSVADIEHLMQS